MASQQNIPPNPHCICQDGTFKLTLEFSEEYPNKPPVVKFLSKMFHPNIIRGRWHLPRHPPEQVEPHLRRLRHPHQYPVTGREHFILLEIIWCIFSAAEWPEPQLPRQLDGRAAVQGEPAWVREEGEGVRGAVLGGLRRVVIWPVQRILWRNINNHRVYFSIPFQL